MAFSSFIISISGFYLHFDYIILFIILYFLSHLYCLLLTPNYGTKKKHGYFIISRITYGQMNRVVCDLFAT